MRVVLANPHYYIYGKTLVNIVLRRKHFMKYDYFLEYYVKHPGRKAAFFIDGTKTSFAAVKVRFPVFPKFFSYLELVLWMLCNRINPLRVPVYFNLKQLNPSEDVVIDFARSVKLSELPKTGYADYPGLVLFLCTHYFLRPAEIAEYLSRVPRALIAAENDLSQEPFFQKHFPFVREVYQLPYTFAPRFRNRLPFERRLNKCLALGSVAPIEPNNRAFLDFFGLDVLQPMRQTLYDEGKKYPEEFDVVIRPFENFTFMRSDVPDDSWALRLLKHHGPKWLLRAILAYRHNRYYKFDIVKKYNRYRLFVSGEEIIGLPPINAFEGMACGTAYLGWDDPMYGNLGLHPGIHYIAYRKNDLSDLVSQVRKYQREPEALARIAEAGSEYVREHFSKRRVADVFWADPEQIHAHFQTTGEILPLCSFRTDRVATATETAPHTHP